MIYFHYQSLFKQEQGVVILHCDWLICFNETSSVTDQNLTPVLYVLHFAQLYLGCMNLNTICLIRMLVVKWSMVLWFYPQAVWT